MSCTLESFTGSGAVGVRLESHLFIIYSLVQMTWYKCCNLLLGLIVVALGVLSKIFACGPGELETGKEIGQKSGKCEKWSAEEPLPMEVSRSRTLSPWVTTKISSALGRSETLASDSWAQKKVLLMNIWTVPMSVVLSLNKECKYFWSLFSLFTKGVSLEINEMWHMQSVDWFS